MSNFCREYDKNKEKYINIVHSFLSKNNTGYSNFNWITLLTRQNLTLLKTILSVCYHSARMYFATIFSHARFSKLAVFHSRTTVEIRLWRTAEKRVNGWRNTTTRKKRNMNSRGIVPTCFSRSFFVPPFAPLTVDVAVDRQFLCKRTSCSTILYDKTVPTNAKHGELNFWLFTHVFSTLSLLSLSFVRYLFLSSLLFHTSYPGRNEVLSVSRSGNDVTRMREQKIIYRSNPAYKSSFKKIHHTNVMNA